MDLAVDGLILVVKENYLVINDGIKRFFLSLYWSV